MLLLLLSSILASGALSRARHYSATTSTETYVDLTPHLNNKAAALEGQIASFDGHNGSYPAEFLPSEGLFAGQGISYLLPDFISRDAFDNVNCTGQTLHVPPGRYQTFGFMGATDGTAYVNGEFHALYEDGSTEALGFVVAPWWLKNPSDGPITAPYSNEGSEDGTTHRNHNITRMFTFQHHLDNSKNMTGVIMPNQTATSQLTGTVSIHVFSITLYGLQTSLNESEPLPAIQNVRSTTKFRVLPSGDEVQLIEVVIDNLASSALGPTAWISTNRTVTLESSFGSIKTVVPAHFQRLRGGDQVRLIVGIQNENGTQPGTRISDVEVLVDGKSLDDRQWNITAGIPEFHVSDDSLMTHESAEWFDGAKFGLFVHWGIYSVPAWTVSGTQYSEWYWYWQHNPANESSAVWKHHKELYGEDFYYDDFFEDFTADHFNATEFVQFVSDIGAQYYVITTKHHDGFSLFDTGDSSDRNSLKYGPKRDLVGEIVNATKESQPQLYAGLYYSLPEWFNPAFAKYGHAGGGDDLYHRRGAEGTPGYDILQRTGFAGGLARNAYNSSRSEFEPYTGYVEVDDFLEDIMKPQMEALFYQYNADILWCDVGGPTIYPELAPAWYNWARSQGRQVIANARCGANYSDFDNPEYSATSHLKLRKWESSEGSDPYSYGYNSDTPAEDYRNASYILQSLVDIVSKNGNYLIDIGPTANGTIVDPSRESLLKVGEWLSFAGEAIYNTTYWFVAAEDQTSNLRFTTKPDAFYVIVLNLPENGIISTGLPLPVKEGDIATFLGPDSSSVEVDWSWTDNGVFELYIDTIEEELMLVEDAWAFKISYNS